MKTVVRSEIGLQMSNNQDSFLILEGEFPVYAVADGMGGHRGGHVGSKMAVEAVKRTLEGHAPDESLLSACFQKANEDIFLRQAQDANLSGMGTTLSVLWEKADSFLLGHVGDSRCYLLRNGVLSQTSTDHSLVAELLRGGVITEDMAADYPYRNVITRAVGTDRVVTADISVLDKKLGDRWLLCSDGLTEYVKAPDLLKFMSEPHLNAAADLMVGKALHGGGHDNITFILMEVDA